MLTLLLERETPALRIRVTDCGCGAGHECETRILFASTHPQLWLAVGTIDLTVDTEDEVAKSVEWFCANEAVDDADGDTPASVVDQGIALVGLTWPELAAGDTRALEQLVAFDALPPWMLRVPAEKLWQTRRCVLGDGLVRVPRALRAVHRAYVAEGPARDAILETLGGG